MTADQQKGRLRSGFTTGACAAAAAKGATLALLVAQAPIQAEIPFPDGRRYSFLLHRCAAEQGRAWASVIKDAGDDPDVTNGAEIIAAVEAQHLGGANDEAIAIKAGQGVGTVTKPGLSVPVGEPAVNPVPLRMIRAAVAEALHELRQDGLRLTVTISVRDGERLAEKTLNRRLGIVGGLSILGTTGIVRPVSAEAWTATIDAAMQVARAAGLDEVLLSAGRTSEAAAQRLLGLPEEAQVMMGDYLEHALKAAQRQGFRRIHLAGMWAKVLKCALGIPQTHVRNGALEVRQAAALLAELGLDEEAAAGLAQANTAKEIHQRLLAQGRTDLVRAVCLRAKEYAEQVSGLPVSLYLVTSEDGVVEQVNPPGGAAANLSPSARPDFSTLRPG
ncbi:MAG: cobalt-precorrin-5B (C(1))-methyltransferase CbiD [Candidatus Electronema sp. V4]|uniref:cobalt-precorrin-5B (C(1))-methyltransferase CbiD n=1 Tax=Candidatus Electronema sp. V4 TaxID=3454756 RepID=UPI0040554A1D